MSKSLELLIVISFGDLMDAKQLTHFHSMFPPQCFINAGLYLSHFSQTIDNVAIKTFRLCMGMSNILEPMLSKC